MSITKRINNGLAAFVLAAATVTSSIILPQTASAFAGGDGTSGNPYQIANCAQLDGMDDNDTDLDKHFMLVDDIDCQSVAMPPIGVTMAGAVKFTGVFDGNDKTISNVALNTFSQGTGLFWATDGATITDLTIDNITAEGEDNVGALAGQTEGGAIENVHVTSGSVSSSTDWGDNFGGLW